MKLRSFVAVGGALCLVAQPALAKEYVVKMKNMGGKEMVRVQPVFEPAFIQAKVGDVVRFVPIDKGHDSVPIPGMVPDGLNLPPGAMSKEYVLRLSKPGVYGIKCTPHFGLGMVALVKAGTGPAPNAAAANAAVAKLPPLARKNLTALLAQAR